MNSRRREGRRKGMAEEKKYITLFEIYTDLCVTITNLVYGQTNVTGDNPADVLDEINSELEPYALSGKLMERDKLYLLIQKCHAFQHQFHVDISAAVSRLEAIYEKPELYDQTENLRQRKLYRGI